jgi:hypothetical protein
MAERDNSQKNEFSDFLKTEAVILLLAAAAFALLGLLL